MERTCDLVYILIIALIKLSVLLWISPAAPSLVERGLRGEVYSVFL
jgi:hypothetical protein